MGVGDLGRVAMSAMDLVVFSLCPVCGVAVRETTLGQDRTPRYESHGRGGTRCPGSMSAVGGEVKMICLHPERKYGAPAEMVYSLVLGDLVCPVCGARSGVLDDEHRAVMGEQTKWKSTLFQK